jgi:hypothetical protein
VRVTKPRASARGGKRPEPQRRDSLSAPPESPSRAQFKADQSSSPFRPNFDSSPLARRAGPDTIAVRHQLEGPEYSGEEEDPGYTDEVVALKDFQDEISRKLAGEKSKTSTALTKRQQASAPGKFRRVLPPFWVWLLVTMLSLFAPYKRESSTVGYCDTGKSTNAILQSLQQKHIASEIHCSKVLSEARVNDTQLALSSTTEFLTCMLNIPALIYPPLSCTPCPPHADCTPHSVTCRASFVKKVNPLSQIPYSDVILNGWPYLGSVTFPEKCVVDPAFKSKLKAVGRDAEAFLAAHRGQIVCKEGKMLNLTPKEQVLKYGIRLKDLNDAMRVYAEKRRKAAGVSWSLLLTILLTCE